VLHFEEKGPMKHHLSNERGLGMVEVIVSMVLIGMVFMSLLSLQGASTRVSDTSGKFSQAVMWANQGLEEALANVNSATFGDGSTTVTSGLLRRTVTVGCAAPCANPWPKLVTATVQWVDSASVARSASVYAIVTTR
jgi:Tfp pilus assembly protein PilV